ncbi:hypothetical protein Dimus_023410 [Dionaea muscipula]
MHELIDARKLKEFFKVGALTHKRFSAKKKLAEGKDDDSDDNDDAHDGDHQAVQEKAQTPSLNATEVVDVDEDQEDDVVNSSGHDLSDFSSQSVKNNNDNVEIEAEPENVEREEVIASIDNDEEDEDNVLLSSKIEALRRGHAEDNDNILLSHKYQATPQSQEADEDMEVVDITPRVLEMDNNTVTFMGTDGIVYDIDDMEALVDMAIEDAAYSTPQSQEADEDMEVVDVTPRVLEMDDNTVTFMGTDGIVYDIDDMEASVDMAIEDAALS